MNIVEPIFFQARHKPSEVALAAPGTPLNLVSYARLMTFVSNACCRLEGSNIQAGDRVVLEVNDPLLRAILTIALARLGVVILSAADGDCTWPIEVTAVISNSLHKTFAWRHIPVDSDWVLEAGRQSDKKEYSGVQSSNLCCVFAEPVGGASGSTKCFALTHELLNARIRRQDAFFGASVSVASRLFDASGLGTSLGVQLLFSTLSRGAALFLMGDQISSFNALATYQVESAVMTPQKLLELVGFYEERPDFQCSLKDIFVVGHVSKSVFERASRTLGAKISIGYYLTQPGMIASMPFQFSESTDNAVGVLFPGVSVKADDEGVHQGRLRAGKLRFRSELSAKIHDGAQTSDVSNTYFETGQSGYLREDQILIVNE